MEKKLYVVVRRDLSWSQRAVQAGHGLAEVLLTKEVEWSNGTLVYLRASNEEELLGIHQQLKELGVEHKTFREPDIGNQMTSLSGLGSNKVFQQLPLL